MFSFQIKNIVYIETIFALSYLITGLIILIIGQSC